MSFEVEIGHASRCGPRETNEDFAGATRAAPADRVQGLIAAIADGVSSGGRGLEAAQTTVMGLLADFFATPATWETSVALDRLIGAQNTWLVSQNRQRESIASLGGGGSSRAAGAAAMTTLSALVLQGQTFTVAHVGDTRIWRVAAGQAQLLTHDHAYTHPDMRSRLTRAIGLDELLHVDYQQGEVRTGDCFVLTSDGVHGALRPRRIAELAVQGMAQAASDALVDAALAAGARDNATALVIRVLGLDAARLEDETARTRSLPPLAKKRIGEGVDGYTITALIADTGVHRLYQARDNRSHELVALKTLHESRAADAQERAMLAHEAWLAQRVTEREARGFVRSRDATGATALYIVYDWHGGQTLEQMLAAGRRFEVAEIVAAAAQIARALGRLHRQGVVHRDIKPGNLHLGDDGQWRVLDLGVALSGRESAAARELHAGTPSYINPEQWSGATPDAASDLFAFGVTLYRWLGGRLPYGEIEPYQAARYRRDPQPLSRLRPDVPIWLDHLVGKAVALDRRHRFETAEELLLALERGASRMLAQPHSTALAQRDPAALWMIGCAISVLANALLIYWLLFLPR
jgi:serine/threonine protein phosphatase PrpC